MNFPPKAWLIWSNEHHQWWRPHGYCRSKFNAGRYTFEEALQICRGANRFCASTDAPNETMIPAEVLQLKEDETEKIDGTKANG